MRISAHDKENYNIK